MATTTATTTATKAAAKDAPQLSYSDLGDQPGNEKQIVDNDEGKAVGRAFNINSDQLPRGYFTSPSFLGSMLAIGLSLACGVGGFGLAAPILALIDEDIGPDPNVVWVALVYTLTTAVGLTIVGRLTDFFGRRWFFIGGSALALIGCIVASTAKNIPTLIGGQVLIGLAASAQLRKLGHNSLAPLHVC